MYSNGDTPLPAIGEADDVITILREVSHAFETLKALRKRTARLAKDNDSTYQELADAMGVNRSSAFALINRDVA